MTTKFLGSSKLLAPVLLLTSSSIYAQQTTDAAKFAEQTVRDVYDKDKAGGVFPLTVEAQRFVRWGDAKKRLNNALENGPVQNIDGSTCSERANTSMERCTGKFYVCSVKGRLAKQLLVADIAICHAPSGGWYLDGLRTLDPLPTEEGVTSPDR